MGKSRRSLLLSAESFISLSFTNAAITFSRTVLSCGEFPRGMCSRARMEKRFCKASSPGLQFAQGQVFWTLGRNRGKFWAKEDILYGVVGHWNTVGSTSCGNPKVGGDHEE